MKNLVVRIPRSNVFRFGDSNAATPVFRGLDWTVKEGESWAVIGSTPSLFKVGARYFSTVHELEPLYFQVLTGHLRISPPPPPPAGLFPFLSLASPPRDPYSSVSFVSFVSRQHASTGHFYDYSARYGALRDDDRTTLRQSMFVVPANTMPLPSSRKGDQDDHALLEKLADKLGLTSLLDLPLVALSNGQTRRSRILKALLGRPQLLLLDEPLSTSKVFCHDPTKVVTKKHLRLFYQPDWTRPTDPVFLLSFGPSTIPAIHASS